LKRHIWRSLAASSLLIGSAWVLRAQDPFEIHVLEYEQLRPGEFTFETHANYAEKARMRITYELTAGVAEHFSLGVMQLSGSGPGSPLESAGWRAVPHFYAPRSWHWPLDVGLVAEFSFQNRGWGADSRSVELLSILEKRFRRIQIDLNPAFGRSLHGPGTDRGWGFGLATRVAFEEKRFTPSLEYYSDWGRIPAFAPLDKQVHQILPGGDFRLAKNTVWSVGVGVGLTPVTSGLVYKSRFEVSFGGRGRH
jgi:hypothetical protein